MYRMGILAALRSKVKKGTKIVDENTKMKNEFLVLRWKHFHFHSV